MFGIISLIILTFAACANCVDDGNKLTGKVFGDSGRQRRLLFYDEEGNLVKTYSNRYLTDFGTKGSNYWNLMNPFLGFLRPSTFSGSTIAYMIPVSDAVVQKINNDPVYQNKLLLLSTRDPVVEINPLCSGKREPIPSPKICSKFLNCWDGWAFEQECPEGLLFSNNGYCDYVYNVDCSNRKIKDIIEPRCHHDFETYRNESDCNEFFVCINNLPVRFKCPSDLYFNQNLGICDYKHVVSCNTSPTVTSSPMTHPTPESTTAPDTSYSTKATDITNKQLPTSTNINPGTVIINSVYDSKSWTTTHVAMSRQDAIRQLKLKSIADVKTAE
ncbi:unnamed protein product [Parnassius mnemosyne]|uniref:Chitin-binding type-2 domain-containing protein n=1 Tax=Parnassius mnemosyne TaxID=213953 RepID=A0AAV1LVH8_9NEOP